MAQIGRMTALLGVALVAALAAGRACGLAPRLLHDAIARRSLTEVKAIAARDPRIVLRPGKDGSTPLHWAATYGTLDIAQFLFSQHVTIDAYNMSGDTPLKDAAAAGQAALVIALLDVGAQVDRPNWFGPGKLMATALHAAVLNNHPDVVKVLLGRAASAGATDKDGKTPLHWAAERAFDGCLAELLAGAADPNARDTAGLPVALHLALRGATGPLRMLIGHGGEVDTLTDRNNTLLHHAARGGFTETVQMLVSLGADPEARTLDGDTPGAAAAKAGKTETAAYLDGVCRLFVSQRARIAAQEASGFKVLPRAPDPPTQVVYRSQWESAPLGPEWSTGRAGASSVPNLQIIRSPTGAHALLGKLGTQDVRLALNGLPEHTQIGIAFDLVIIGAWDGNSTPPDGPDLWGLGLGDGHSLIETSFSRAGVPGKPQSYPGWYPISRVAARTGSRDAGVMGFGGSDPAGDTTYRLSYTFPHSGPQLELVFSGRNLEPITNESWALANVIVLAGPVAAPTAVEKTPPPAAPRPPRARRSAGTVHRPTRTVRRRVRAPLRASRVVRRPSRRSPAPAPKRAAPRRGRKLPPKP